MFFVCLFGFDRTGRAAVLARAAIDAHVGIDNVSVSAGSNRSYGTGFRARAASNAFIRYFMCHNELSFKGLSNYFFNHNFGEVLTVAVETTIAFAAFLLEDNDLVTFHQ